mmetsp:Transcript_1140/g.1887  ORF Transcript_1140/g.1887 Transcript_1140/m.1887 type:complete len:517 (+) Transcript_1140:1427-2977(+)
MGNRIRGQNICSSRNVAESNPSNENLHEVTQNFSKEISNNSEVDELKIEKTEESLNPLTPILEVNPLNPQDIITDNIVNGTDIVTKEFLKTTTIDGEIKVDNNEEYSWRRCSLRLDSENSIDKLDDSSSTSPVGDPLIITLVPHQHTLFCERKQRVCSAVGKLQELEYLQVTTQSGQPLSDYSFHWIRYKAAKGSSHEVIENSQDCNTYQLQRMDVGRWISISYRRTREEAADDDPHSDREQDEGSAASRGIVPFVSTDSLVAQSAPTASEEHSPDTATSEEEVKLEEENQEEAKQEEENQEEVKQQEEKEEEVALQGGVVLQDSSAVESGTESMTATASVEVTASSTGPTAGEPDVEVSIATAAEPLTVDTVAQFRRVRRRLGPVLAGPPRLLAMTVRIEPAADPQRDGEQRWQAVARTSYIGGEEGESEFWWFRISADGRRLQLTEPAAAKDGSADPRCYLITEEDVGCTLKAKCRPVRQDGFKGEIFTSKSSPVIQLNGEVCDGTDSDEGDAL